MKSVLLTGATGFIGRHTLGPLLTKGFKVHAIYAENKPVLHEQNIFWHQVDLHDAQAVKNLLEEISPSYLLHLAWYTKPDEYWASPLNIQWLNSSINLLNLFIKVGGRRVVFVGSCAEYDWQYRQCNEFLTPCVPQTLYGSAKHSLHLLTRIIAAQHNLSFAWGRLFFLFGTHEYPQRLIPSVLESLFNKKNFVVKNGEQIRDFMYVNDAADALVTLLDCDITGPVNIASGKPIAIRDLMSTIAERLGGSHWIEYKEKGTKIDDVLEADVTRLFNEVKWQPQYLLEAAIDNTIAWYRDNRLNG